MGRRAKNRPKKAAPLPSPSIATKDDGSDRRNDELDELLSTTSPPTFSFLGASPVALLSAACILASLLLYWNTHENLWAFDDSRAILRNRDLFSSPISDLWKNDYWGTTLASSASHKSFRPLTVLTFRWNRQLSGGSLDPRSFHIWNNVLNAVASCLAVWTTAASVSDPATLRKRSSCDEGSTSTPYLVVTSLLFAFHPIHTEAVANTAGRAEILGGIFAFATYLCHQRCLLHGGGIKLFPAVPFLGLLAAFCKETGLMALALCGANEVASIWIPSLFAARPRSTTSEQETDDDTKKNEPERKLLPSVIRFTLLASAGIFYLCLRVRKNGERLGVRTGLQDNPLLHAKSRVSYVLTALHIQAVYIWKLIYPHHLMCDYGFDTIPMIENVSDARNAATLAWAVGLVYLIRKGWTIARDDRDPRLLIGLAWIICFLLPASHILPIGTVLGERLLYVPSLGYAMLLGLAAEHFIFDSIDGASPSKTEAKRIGNKATIRSGRQKRFTKVVSILAGVLSIFGKATVQRNRDWHDSSTLWEADYASHPNNVKIATNRARDLFSWGDMEQVHKITHSNYQRSKGYLANLVMYGKTAALTDSGGRNFSRAYELLDEGIAIVESRRVPKSFDFEVYTARAFLLTNEQKMQEAVQYYRKALEVASIRQGVLAEPHCNMGEILATTGSWSESIQHLESCVELSDKSGYTTGNTVTYIANLGKAYYVTKQNKKAQEVFQRTLSIQDMPDIRKYLEDVNKKLAAAATKN